jgi:hypothetical protein
MDAAAAELDADEVEMQRQQLQHKQHVAAVAHSARMSLAQQCAAALPTVRRCKKWRIVILENNGFETQLLQMRPA